MCLSLAVITGSNPAELHRCLSVVNVEVMSGRGVCDRLMTHLEQYFTTIVRPRPGKFYFHKTRARSQQIYS